MRFDKTQGAKAMAHALIFPEGGGKGGRPKKGKEKPVNHLLVSDSFRQQIKWARAVIAEFGETSDVRTT